MSTEKTPPPIILGRYAGFFSCAAAYALDRLITFGISFVILLVLDYFLTLFQIDQRLESLSEEGMLNAVLALLLSIVGIYLLVSIAYNVGFWLLSGQTPGKRLLGVRVMRADGARLRLGNALRRQVGYWISSILYLGFLWILFDNKRQGFHDKLAGTIVTYSWPEGRLRGDLCHPARTAFHRQGVENVSEDDPPCGPMPGTRPPVDPRRRSAFQPIGRRQSAIPQQGNRSAGKRASLWGPRPGAPIAARRPRPM